MKNDLMFIVNKNNEVVGIYNVKKISMAGVVPDEFLLQNDLNFYNKIPKSIMNFINKLDIK